MIAIRFLIFFYDQKEDRSHRLAAVTPLFSSPSAIKTLMKTAKFEGRPSLVVTGEKEPLEKLVKKVERLDVTDWLAIDTWEPLKENLIKTIESIEGLSVYEPTEEQLVVGQEAVLAGKKYPPDLPVQNQELWDEIAKLYRQKLKGSQDEKAAIQRRLYNELAKRQGLVPWVEVSKSQSKDDLIKKLEEGEAKAHEILGRLLRHAMSEGLVKKTQGIKYWGAEEDNSGVSRLTMAHGLTWVLQDSKSWKELADYLVKKEAFNRHGLKMISLKINPLTDLEIFGENGTPTASVFIYHRLTQAQASDLLGEVPNPIRELNRLGKMWHELGRFPTL